MLLKKIMPGIGVVVLFPIISFLVGVLQAHNKEWPSQEIIEIQKWYMRYLETGSLSPKNRVFVPDHMMPESNITIMKENENNMGMLAIELWNEKEDEYGIRLLDRNRNLIHYWALDYLRYDKDGPHNGSDNPHGMQIFRDGSVIVTHDKGDVLVKIDKCGNPIWVKKGFYHHLITIDDYDTVWLWQAESSARDHFQKIINLNPDTGDTIKEIDLIEDVIRKHDAWEIFGLTKNYQFKHFTKKPPRSEDIFHPNEIEVLPKHLEDKFPQFQAGDLMISIRNQNLIAILDKQNSSIKWSMRGPWKGQHDPDFEENGLINIYNNKAGKNRSELISVNPITKETTKLFNKKPLKFHSKTHGAHQTLPHDRTVLLVAEKGRVVEFGHKNQEILFEYYNIATKKALAHIQNVTWLPDDYFDSPLDCNS